MQLLKTLEKERLPENKRPKEYYVRLTDIFKRYLSRKTNQYQLHLTADELLLELRSLDLPQEKISGYAACLRLANAVKFAKYLPADYDNEKSFEETKNIIEAIQGLERKKAEDGV